ncbi:hypothetical protein C8035_v010753 [Colletotrichum spinosum]|uniref:Uncharacterized protein n=1 Tax=Colletotrichum spinosum TaxID=1347390 RepID=A0A4R8QE55_9PEZI|nr:hypothetical protein C8035_v010753 [Colletotrichum spinosum]
MSWTPPNEAQLRARPRSALIERVPPQDDDASAENDRRDARPPTDGERKRKAEDKDKDKASDEDKSKKHKTTDNTGEEDESKQNKTDNTGDGDGCKEPKTTEAKSGAWK